MEIILHRAYKKPNYTIGKWYINGKPWRDCCEDPDRGLNMWMPLKDIEAKKVYGATAIPCGRYEITLTHSPAFGRVLPLLNGVPGWSGVRIHAGNSPADSKGCLLPGDNKAVGKVLNSRAAEKELVELMQAAHARGEKNYITII